MNKVKTCVYAIALNEIKHVDTFMDHCQGADLVLICDTGSTDGTVERFKELGALVYSITQRPWRFDVPRNTALSLVPMDIDICLSIDIDEYLQPGWANAIDQVWQRTQGTVKRISYDYIWNWQTDGVTPDIRFFADKIHHRRGYRWRHPCHETLYWEGVGDEVREVVPELILHHRADVTKSRSQYNTLLALATKEDPNNDRMSHYYGRELMFYNRYQESIDELKRHLNLPTAQWKEERSASMRYISRNYRNLGNLAESQAWALRATQECPGVREPWLELARAAYAAQDWLTCYWAAKKCLNIVERTMTYMGSSDCWGHEPHDFAAISAYHMGLSSEAYQQGLKAVELNPDDQRLVGNLAYYQEKYQPRG